MSTSRASRREWPCQIAEGGKTTYMKTASRKMIMNTHVGPCKLAWSRGKKGRMGWQITYRFVWRLHLESLRTLALNVLDVDLFLGIATITNGTYQHCPPIVLRFFVQPHTTLQLKIQFREKSIGLCLVFAATPFDHPNSKYVKPMSTCPRTLSKECTHLEGNWTKVILIEEH